MITNLQDSHPRMLLRLCVRVRVHASITPSCYVLAHLGAFWMPSHGSFSSRISWFGGPGPPRVAPPLTSDRGSDISPPVPVLSEGAGLGPEPH